MKKKSILNDVLVNKGYFINFKISKKEINILKNIIKISLLDNLKKNSIAFNIIKKIDLQNYHKYSEIIEHRELMKKNNRLIKPKNVKKIKKLKFYKNLKKILPYFKIINFENIYKEEIDYRIVRPNKKDVSPLHRDEWFWSLNKRKINKNATRIKIWIPLICERGKNGLRFVHKSHLDKFELKSTTKREDGMFKPGEINKKFKVNIFKSDPGDCFIFNDKLIHGGLSGGSLTRVSMEFTMLIKNKDIDRHITIQ